MSTSQFRKNERIVSKKLIDQLFTSPHRHSLVAYPLRAVYIEPSPAPPATRKGGVKVGVPATDSPAPVEEGTGEESVTSIPTTQILVSVSKRHFKHAVDRNRAKRQIREAYRLNKTILSPFQHPTPSATSLPSLLIAFIWLADKPVDSRRVNASMKELLHKLNVHHPVSL